MRVPPTLQRSLTASLATLCFAACGSSTVELELQFLAQVGDEAFACGKTYAGVGASQSTFTPADLRLFISELRLLSPTGEEVPVTLVQDGLWQVQNVALLDFEDKTGKCSSGSTQTNARIRGSVPDAAYDGVRFTLGLPFELNHGDAATAPSPLNVSAMFWSWNAGYRFLKLDGGTPAIPSFAFHLGSTGCTADQTGKVTRCTSPNRVEITLQGLDPFSEPIVLDLAGLFEGVDLDFNTAETSALCMSSVTDPDCAGPFQNLGLPFGTEPDYAASQKVFRVRRL